MDTDMDEFFNPGCGGTGGAGCDCGDCEEWRRYCYWNHDHGHTRQFLLFASDDEDYLCIPWEVTSQLRNMITDSEPIKLEAPDGQIYSVEFVKFGLIILTTGWRRFVDANHIRQGDPILFVYCGGSSFKVQIRSSSGPENYLPCCQQPPNIFRAVPPRDPPVLNEQVVPDPAHVRTSTDFGYTMFLGTCLTKAQEKKVLELSLRSEISLHVAPMNKRNANEYYVYIPLRLLDNFKEGINETLIQLEAHGNNMVYGVGASKHSDDQIILQSGLSPFVASLHIQDTDLLIFRSKEKARLEVLVFDPSGCEKTCFAMGNSSNAREVCEDSVEIVDPPPRTLEDTIIDLSSDDDEIVEEGSSDDDEVVEEGSSNDDEVVEEDSSDDNEVMEEGMTSSRREQRPLRGCRAKAQEMASTSSPCTKSGHKAGKSKEASLEVPMSNNPYILPEGTELISYQEEKVKEKVRAIGSEFPVFVKRMTVQELWQPKRLNFCMEYARACLPLEETPVLLGLKGSNTQWPSTLKVKRYTEGRTIYSFWRDLVFQAKMKPGDICLVELAHRSSENLKMTVHLIRESEPQL